jgi:tetratricopeptide (TPR) repeat protein
VARIGMIEQVVGRHGEAEIQFENAVTAAHEAVPAWVWSCRGANLVAAGDTKRAKECYRFALNAGDDFGDQLEAYYSLGRVLRSERHYRDAADAFREVVRRCPAHREARDALSGIERVFDALQLAGAVEGQSDHE